MLIRPSTPFSAVPIGSSTGVKICLRPSGSSRMNLLRGASCLTRPRVLGVVRTAFAYQAQQPTTGFFRGTSSYNGHNQQMNQATNPPQNSYNPAQPQSGSVLQPPREVDWDVAAANSISIIGRLGNDPTYRMTNSGIAVANASIAVKCGGRNEDTDWFELEFWREKADMAKQFLTKGQSVCVQGKVRIDNWNDKVTGEQRFKVKVVVQDLQRVKPGDFAQNSSSFQPQQGGGFAPASQPDLQDWSQMAKPYAPPVPNPYTSSPINTYQAAPSAGNQRSSFMQTGSTVSACRKAGSNRSIQDLWRACLDNPSGWYDNRTTKTNPKAPDFKEKSGDGALWLSNNNTPTWVHMELNKPKDSASDHATTAASFTQSSQAAVAPAPATFGMTSSGKKDHLWRDYLDNPSDWFDNRGNKRSEKSPDFKKKQGEGALWIDSYDTPAWVHSELNIGMTPESDFPVPSPNSALSFPPGPSGDSLAMPPVQSAPEASWEIPDDPPF